MSVPKRRPLAALTTVVGLIFAAFAFSTSASAYPAGQSARLSANASAVTQGGAITVSGSHFKGTVTLTATGTSQPFGLGTVTAGADGAFSKRVTLPAGQFPPGSYTITATDDFGDSQSISVSVVASAVASNPSAVTSSSSAGTSSTSNPSSGGGALAMTGVAVVSIAGLGVLLLLGGGLVLLIGKRPKAVV